MRVALIHAVRVAMQPVEDAFQRHWPQAERVNLLDDSLSPDRERDAELTPAMSARIAALAQYALGTGASAILYTCSAFGEAIEAVKRSQRVPVLKPNEAMFDEALHYGTRIGMLATFAPSVASMEAEFGKPVKTICVPEAMAALKAGDGETHDRLLAQAAPRLGKCDAIMLAHFSTARARDAVSRAVDCPVLTAPDAAVLKLKSLVS
jgi:aspartate/glutamate racemase